MPSVNRLTTTPSPGTQIAVRTRPAGLDPQQLTTTAITQRGTARRFVHDQRDGFGQLIEAHREPAYPPTLTSAPPPLTFWARKLASQCLINFWGDPRRSKEKGPLNRVLVVVELPGIETAAKSVVNCGNAECDHAKRRHMTCGWAYAFDVINITDAVLRLIPDPVPQARPLQSSTLPVALPGWPKQLGPPLRRGR
jgi:hypothetical protein